MHEYIIHQSDRMDHINLLVSRVELNLRSLRLFKLQPQSLTLEQFITIIGNELEGFE